MSSARSLGIRALLLLPAVAAVTVTVGSYAATGHGRPVPKKPGKAVSTVVPTPVPSPTWKEVDRLISEQKFAEASQRVAAIRLAAQKSKDSAEWTRALIREVQLRTGLHGYETAVRFLKDEPWPEDLLSRVALELFYAQSLVHYAQAYAWEISQREKVESREKVDLKAWTREEIFEQARQAYLEVWRKREALGASGVGKLAEYLDPNNYPEHIRGTLRDAVTYLFVELLADTSGWSPSESNEVYELDLTRLLAQEGPVLDARLDDPASHPLVKITAALSDLEAWHAGAGRREASLEARLERLRRLHASWSEEPDRASIRKDLSGRLPRFRDFPWWAMGMATLAEFLQAEDAADNLIRARQAAQEGAKAYAASHGGKRCLSIVRMIEAPDYLIASMASDGADRRSIQVTHRNLPALYFRAYPVDLEERIETARDWNLLPAGPEIEMRLRGPGAAAAEWSAAVPATPDFKSHRTYVTPPLKRPGLYAVVASARKDFPKNGNRITAVNFLLTDLVLVTRPEAAMIEVRALWGASGGPVSGAEVSLYQYDWTGRKHHKTETRKSGADGLVRFDHRPGRESKNYFVLGKSGREVALDANYLSLSKATVPSEMTRSLLYTDRSIYRPLQTIEWKVLVYQGRPDLGRLETAAGTPVTVSLMDANNQKVDSKTLSTNAYGSASGRFSIPTGRALGAWRVESSLYGMTQIGVEEYKRPTFEVEWKDPKEPLRLNRPATLTGSARYYFGLPVTTGTVRWRVVRSPEFPWWWSRGWHGHSWGRSLQQPQTVATGTAELKPDGTFEARFTPSADERIGGGGEARQVVYAYTASVDVVDEGGETRSDSRGFRLGLVTVQASIQMETAFLREETAGQIAVTRTDLDGVPRAGQGSWKLFELRQPERALTPAEMPVAGEMEEKAEERYKTPGDRLRPRWESHYSIDSVLRTWSDGRSFSQGALAHETEKKGEARVALPGLPAGAYRFRYETADEFGAKHETFKDFLVAGEKMSVKLPAVLIAETSSVAVGGTARLLAFSGWGDQPLFLDIFRDGKPVERKTLTGGADSVIEIPVGEAQRGGFGARLSGLRDHQLLDQSETVFVPWDNKKLEVSFASFRDKIRPGTKETWRVTVKAPRGGDKGEPTEGRAAELLAYMYDRSLDTFRPHHPVDPLALYPNRSGVGSLHASLGQASAQWISDEEFAPIPGDSGLLGDRLKFFGGYAIGGMGRRGPMRMRGDNATVTNGLVLEEAESSTVARPPASSPAPMEATGTVTAERQSRDEARAMKAEAPSAPPVTLRSDFSETAFWRPHLLTDSDGSASIEFTVPDSVTSWNVWVHAITKDLQGGSIQKETRSAKDLLVRPYVPRFLREGDRADLKVVVNNSSEREMSGKVTLEILDTESSGSALEAFGVAAEKAILPFRVAAGGGTNATFSIAAPKRTGSYAFQVTAVSGDTSDGELRPVPVLPGRLHLVQSRFVTLRHKDRRTMTFEDLAAADDPTRINEQLVVTVDAQLFYSVLQALPYLVNYPYECTEQILNRFVPTSIVSSLYRDYPAVAKMAEEFAKRETRLETWDLPDPNRKMALEETPWLETARGGKDSGHGLVRVLDPRAAKAERDASLAKLRKAQTVNGGFPWWPGGPPSPYMTVYILHGFSNALDLGAEVPKDMVQKAWAYVRGYLREDLERCMAHDGCWELVTFINYTLSSYPDASWYSPAFTPADRQRLLDYSFRHWKKHSPCLKAQLALTLKRMARPKDAILVWSSVMDSAKTDRDLGTYWAPEDRSWLWYNDTIETQAFALRTLLEVSPSDPRKDGLVQWLLLNKKLNQWKSTRATAEVIYSLVHYLKKEGALAVREEATVTVGPQKVTFTFEPDRYTGKKNQIVIPGEKVDSKTSSTVAVQKETKGLLFASTTWHFSTERLPEEDRGDFFGVSRKYFKRESGAGGFVLKPLVEGAVLRPGDQVEVQISLRSKHAAEYVHLRDPRGAGLEPENAVSRHKWNLGIVWYEETRDSGTNFFFEQLPVGEYTFKYRLRANMAGVFRVGPATVQSMYAPEFAAYSAGASLTVASVP